MRFAACFWGYPHDVKGNHIWIFDSHKLELTRSVTLQELPMSNYVQVIRDLPATARVKLKDDDDADIMQLPVMATQNDVEPMFFDQAGTDQTNSPPSKFDSLNPRQNFDSVLDPDFEIDDVYMESTDLDVDPTRDIVPRGTWVMSMVL